MKILVQVIFGGDDRAMLFIFLKDVAVGEVNFVVSVYLISCNGFVVVALFCTQLNNQQKWLCTSQ